MQNKTTKKFLIKVTTTIAITIINKLFLNLNTCVVVVVSRGYTKPCYCLLGQFNNNNKQFKT